MEFLQNLSRNVLNDNAHDHVTAFLSSARSHPRARSRFTAIVAASCGCFSNFVVLVIASLTCDYSGPSIVTGCAYIPLLLSLIWHHLDFVSKRVFNQEFPPAIVIFLDGFAFFGFLTVIIASIVIASEMRYEGGLIVLMTYNSIPWMICCSNHATIVVREIMRTSGIFLNSFGTAHRCTSCGQQKPSWAGTNGNNSESVSLLGGRNRYADDIEANGGAEQDGERTTAGTVDHEVT